MRTDNQTFHLICCHRSCPLPTCHFIYLNNLPQTQKTHTSGRYRISNRIRVRRPRDRRKDIHFEEIGAVSLIFPIQCCQFGFFCYNFWLLGLGVGRKSKNRISSHFTLDGQESLFNFQAANKEILCSSSSGSGAIESGMKNR